ncbi:unnamed protein product [Nippostrongylus brasiliensis]|uniref:MFS domain-containing protein n=1 Tax=Nippostrongylus brasiliensis TaxID=27835 RepID=A0A158R0Q3_NIPBR|nr:unnamed protein product [Nippostrongylus brasiliensis]
MVALNVPAEIMQQSLNESVYTTFGLVLSSGSVAVLWSIIVSCQSVGALLGCFMVTPLLHRRGVKSSLMLGSLSCFVHIFVCFGAAVAAVLSLDFLLGGRYTWGYLLFAPAILGAVQIVGNSFIPETPNYYLQNGCYIQAIDSIKFFYGIVYDDDDEAIQEYWDMVPEMPSQMGLLEASRSWTICRGILFGAVLSASQVFSGSVASISYSTSMFDAVSFTKVLIPFLPALGSLISIVLTVPALKLVETTLRRPLLLKTLALCLMANCLLLVFSLVSMDPADSWWASWLYLAAFFIYGIGYNLGVGPLAYFMPAELVPLEAAGVSLGEKWTKKDRRNDVSSTTNGTIEMEIKKATGVAVAVNWLCSMVTTLVFYPLNEGAGGWSYLFFIIPSLIFLLLLYFFLPETSYPNNLDPVESRLLMDLGPPPLPYGTFVDDGLF